MDIVIEGLSLPGRDFFEKRDIHVGLKVRNTIVEPVRGDAGSGEWRVSVTHLAGDFGGPAVQGPRGRRYLELCWGTFEADGWQTFKRAQLPLHQIERRKVAEADRHGKPLVATVFLTNALGQPQGARLVAPAVQWSVRHLAPSLAS